MKKIIIFGLLAIGLINCNAAPNSCYVSCTKTKCRLHVWSDYGQWEFKKEYSSVDEAKKAAESIGCPLED